MCCIGRQFVPDHERPLCADSVEKLKNRGTPKNLAMSHVGDLSRCRYDASQKFGEEVRASGGAGLLYDSLRRRTGVNVVAHRPRNITDIVQTDHFEISVQATSRMIDVRKLSL